MTRVDLDEATWAPAPHRHEAGTPNVLGVAALAQACRTLAPVLDGPGPAHERVLLDRLAAGLATVPGRDPAARSGPTARIGWRCRASRSRATPPVASPRTCRPSTASGCGTAGSAPTRCWSGCAGTRTAPTGPRSAPASGWAPRPSTWTGWSPPCTRSSPGDRAGPTPRSTAGGRPRRTRASATRWASAPPGRPAPDAAGPGLSRRLRAYGSVVPAATTFPASAGSRSAGTGWRSSTRLPRESWWISTASAMELISGMPAPPIGQTVDGGRLDRRYPVAVVDDLDAQRAGFGPQGQLDDPGAPRPVGVADGVRRRLVDGQHHAGGLVVGQRERGEPARQLATDHRQLRRVGGPAAVHELDSAVLGHVSSSLCVSPARCLSVKHRLGDRDGRCGAPVPGTRGARVGGTRGLRATAVPPTGSPGPPDRKRRPPRPPHRWSGRRSWPSTRRSLRGPDPSPR